MLLSTGWDVEDVDLVLSGRFHPLTRMSDVQAESRADTSAVADAVAALKARGFAPEVLRHTEKTTPAWVTELWESYTKYPWWTGAHGGHRTIAIVGPTNSILERTTASFIYDLWTNLGETNSGDCRDLRMPVIRRLNLLSWASAEALRRFESDIGPGTDVAVVYGGLGDVDHIHETMHYVTAMGAAFKGVLLFEMPSDDSVSATVLMGAARRAGFNVLLGVGGRNV